MYIYARGGKYVTKYQQHFPLSHVGSIMTREEEEKPSATSSCMQAEKKRQIVREKTTTQYMPPRDRGRQE
jgi:hypothetical protein